jgi:hypothetical protein
MAARVYTLPEVLALLKLSRTAFYRHQRAGKLPFLEELQPRYGPPRYRADLIDRYTAGRWGGPRLLVKARR